MSWVRRAVGWLLVLAVAFWLPGAFHRGYDTLRYGLTNPIVQPALAQVGCVPNPNNSGPPFVNGCPITAAGLNVLANAVGIGLPQVSSNSGLTSLSGSFSSVVRLGFTSAGDSPQVTYTLQNSPCSLGSGAGDGGSQVPVAGGGKCWIANLVGPRLTPMVWGCAGNGTTDDTVCSQAAVTATETAGVPLFLDDGVHKYLWSSSIVSTKTPHLEGTIGRQGGLLFTGGNFVCQSGVVVNSNIVALIIKGAASTPSSYVVKNICFQLAPTPGTRASGAAISVGGVTTASQLGGIIEGNAIINPYEGIVVDSDVAAVQIATQQIVLRDNIIREPTNIGIVWGRNSQNDSTSGTLENNFVACNVTGTSAVGYAVFDGDWDYDGKNQGEGDCFVGMKIVPNSGSVTSQNFGGHFKNVSGDSSGTHATGGTPHELVIQPGTNGVVSFLTFTGAWASGGTTPNGDAPILIDCTGTGVACWQISFDQLTARTGGANQNIMEVKGAVANFSLENSLLCSWFSGTVTNGLVLTFNSSTSSHWKINHNRIGNCAGSGGNAMTNGVVITQNSSNMWLEMIGNDASDATNPYVTTFNATGDALIANNMGADDNIASVASAATITLPGLAKYYNITGTTTVTAITNSAWFNREIILRAASGFTFNTGTNGACVSSATIAAGTSEKFIWDNFSTCWSHVI